MTDNDQAAVEALINVIWDGSDCRRPGWEPLARDILAAIRAGKVTVPEDAPRIAGLRAEVDLYKNGATCRAEERDSARAERDNFKRRLIEAEDGRARMHAEVEREKARADKAEADYSRCREMVVWGFYEDKVPEYTQGVKGEHVLCSPITADEANGTVREAAKATAERDRLAALLIESNRLLKDAKRHLGPHTTNSDADTAIARNDAALAEIGGWK